MTTLSRATTLGLLVLASSASPALAAPTVDPFYAANYTLTGLGAVPGLPANYGGLTFLADDPTASTLLIGGSANTPGAAIYRIGVTRDTNHHITGFVGSATKFACAPGLFVAGGNCISGGITSGSGGIDGGLVFGPGNVLFYTSFPDNSVGELKPGSILPDKQPDLTPLGILPSVGALTFVPAGLPGAGRLKIASFDSQLWYDTTVSPDATGTFTIAAPAAAGVFLNALPEGMVYVKAGNPDFAAHSILLSHCCFSSSIFAYEVDANGDPILATRRPFITGLRSAEGATVDPLTGDFLFSDQGTNEVLIVQGFLAPNEPPLARCKNVTVPADASSCQAPASVDDGSFDPDGDPITLAQSPRGPYGLGLTTVTLTATDPLGLTSSCQATVTVVDVTPPTVVCVPVASSSSKKRHHHDDDDGDRGERRHDDDGDRDKKRPHDDEGDRREKGHHDDEGDDDEAEGGLFKVTATDACSAAAAIKITLGGIPLANGETIRIEQEDDKPGVRLEDPKGHSSIKRFEVGPGGAVVVATDASGNTSRATCPIPRDDDNQDRHHHDNDRDHHRDDDRDHHRGDDKDRHGGNDKDHRRGDHEGRARDSRSSRDRR